MTGKSAQAGAFPKYFSPFGNGYPQGGTTNGAVARFITRTSWDTTATWLCAEMGGAFYGDHHHYQAGHIYLSRGKYPLLISPGNYRGTNGMGLMGSSVGDYITMSAMKNTLFFDDWGVYNRYESVYQVGGQGRIGDDRIIAAWQDNGLTYIRSDLSTAYNNDEYPRSIRDTAQRTLEQFYRTVAYLNTPNVAIVFDRVKAKNSTHARGQYEKHLRWHVPTQPVINGNTATVRNGNSKLHITTLLPENQTITPVALNPNPDNHYSGMSYLFNSPVWRVEVREQGNPLESDWLTILQTGDTTTAVAFSEAIMDNQFTMKGAQFVVNGKNYYVLFNNRNGATPSPIDMTSYSIDGGESHHVLGGLYPSAVYNVAWSNGTVVVTLDATGAYTTNAAGVLEFDIPTGSIKTTGNTAAEVAPTFAASVSPNPAADVLRVSFTLPENAANVRVMLADALGVTVAVLHNGAMNTGSYSLESDVTSVSSGAYYCTIETATGRTVIPVTIIR